MNMRPLSYEQICSVTVGALRTWEEEGRVCFSKLSAAQMESLLSAVPAINPSAVATTGGPSGFLHGCRLRGVCDRHYRAV